MRVLVAGGSGVIGRQLVPKLQEQGHEVLVTGRSRQRFEALGLDGVAFRSVDLLDAGQVDAAFSEHAPDAAIHVATAIPQKLDAKKMAREFEPTNRLRAAGAANLARSAGRHGGVKLVSQSIAFAYDPAGSGLRAEGAPLWRDPPKPFAGVLEAVEALEAETLEHGGVVLRLGHLYGPGTGLAADGHMAEQVRRRQMPLVGEAASRFSFVHAADAADAFAAALGYDGSAVFNVVDDDPAAISAWLPAYAEALGAKPPRRMPAPLVRLAAGSWGLAYLTRLVGADNALAKAQLGWTPAHASWREGLLGSVRGHAGSATA